MSLERDFPALFQALQAGPLPFDAFMKIALYDENHGFYTRQKDIKDHFVTAPMLGRWLAMAVVKNCLQFFPEFLDLGITEWGAGRGDLMLQIMLYLDELGHAVNYECIECSPVQQAHIQAKISQLPSSLQHRVSISSSPTQNKGLILANEFLDALPFKRFVFSNGVIFEQGVMLEDGRLQYINMPSSDRFKEQVESLDIHPGEADYVSELSLSTPDWFYSQLKAAGDAYFLIMDYGYLHPEYYHPERNNGSFQAIRNHKVLTDMLNEHPGTYDMTAHVNFSTLIELLTDQPYRYRTQRHFLLDSGIFDELDPSLDPAQAGMIKTLLMPGQMGDLIKVFEVMIKNEET